MTVVQRISAFEEGLRPIVQSQGRCCKCKAVRAPGYQDQGSSLQYGLEWSFVPLSPPTPLTRENAEASLEQSFIDRILFTRVGGVAPGVGRC